MRRNNQLSAADSKKFASKLWLKPKIWPWLEKLYARAMVSGPSQATHATTRTAAYVLSIRSSVWRRTLPRYALKVK
jgi:hypothetical protein